MRELLADNIALAERLATLPQQLQKTCAHNSQLDSQREVSSLTSWTWAFTTYIAVLSQARPDLTVSCPAYMRNILQEASRIGNEEWHTYDYAFRSQVVVDSSLDWSEIVPSLFLAYRLVIAIKPLCQQWNCHALMLSILPNSTPDRCPSPLPRQGCLPSKA